MKKMKKSLFFAVLFTVMILAPVIFVSCEDEITERCKCDTKILEKDFTVSTNIYILDKGANSHSDLAYYNGEYYFTKKGNDGKTYYYFICNPSLIDNYADTVVYNVYGTVHKTSNILFDQIYNNDEVYY